MLGYAGYALLFIVLFKQASAFCFPDENLKECSQRLKIQSSSTKTTLNSSLDESTTLNSSLEESTTLNSSLEESTTLNNSLEESTTLNSSLEESTKLNSSSEELTSESYEYEHYDYNEYTDNEDDYEFEITSRRLVYGRSCFSNSGFFGSCSTPKFCKNRSYSYSRTCGFSYICCKNQNTIDRKEAKKTTTRRTTRRTTTRRTTTRRTTTRRTTNIADIVGLRTNYESLNTPGCGISISEFIFGGEEARKGFLPFMVSFVETYGRRRRNRPKKVENFCGGVLISPRHVLTAAHCFSKVPSSAWKRGRVDVRLGLVDITDRETPQTRVNIAKVKIHENYQETQRNYFNPVNDIAVVTLDRSIDLGSNSGVNTVCLPTKVDNKPNRKGLVAGWGTTSQVKKKKASVNKLRFAYITEFDRAECSNKYNDLITRKGSSIRVGITENMLCAGNSIADTCAGDSGGPLLWVDSEYRYAVGGIVSFGPASCGNVVPGVYTKVDKYLDWIKEQITN